MNYFQLFDFPITLNIDVSLLRKKYYALSRLSHIDMNTEKSEEEKIEIEDKNAQINRAYEVLGNENKRLAYVLEILNIITKEEKQVLSPTFLMDMMDFNENLEMAIENQNLSQIEELKKDLDQRISSLESDIQNLSNKEDMTQMEDKDREKLKIFYYEKKYLLRIQKRFITFADPN